MDKKIKNTVVLDQDNCPHCGSPCDAASSTKNQKPPTAGDLSICFYCAGLLRFKEDLKLKVLSEEEFNKLPQEIQDELKQLQLFVSITPSIKQFN